MAWIYLLIAGGMEIVWSACLKLSEGFSVMRYTISAIVGMIFSFIFLAKAIETLPLGTAYATWTGIGALGAVIVGILLFKDAVTPARLFFTALLIIGLIGLNATGH